MQESSRGADHGSDSEQFRYINFHWIRRTLNNEANDLAQMASGYKETADGVDVEVQFLEPGDWKADIFNYLKDSARGHLEG